MRKKFNFFGRKITGKGYYIALVLCAAAIGISGYMFYLSANQTNTENPSQDVIATGGDIQAGATQPSGTTTIFSAKLQENAVC